MSALPHIFKPTLATIEKTRNGHPTGPLLLYCASITIEQDIEADERLAAKQDYCPFVIVPMADGVKQEQNEGGGVKRASGVCTFRVPLQPLRDSQPRVKKEEPTDD